MSSLRNQILGDIYLAQITGIMAVYTEKLKLELDTFAKAMGEFTLAVDKVSTKNKEKTDGN